MTERKVKANRTNRYCKEWNALHWIRPQDVTIAVEAIHEATDIDIENTTVIVTTIVQATVIASAAATHRCIPRRLVILVVEVDNMIMMTGLLSVCIWVVAATSILEATSIVRATTAHEYIVEFG